MTQIDFYTHVGDKLALTCKLVDKAYRHQLRTLVLTPDSATTQAIDRMLWTQPAIGFLPHCRADSALTEQTPIVIDHAVSEALPHDDLLINLCSERPQHFSRFRRLIEVVTEEPEDRSRARERFKFYRERGYEIRSHNMSSGGNDER